MLERQEDLARIRAALQAAQGGRGQVLWVEGPAGIGKSTLLAELAADAAAHSFAVHRARGEELERELPHGIVRQLSGPGGSMDTTLAQTPGEVVAYLLCAALEDFLAEAPRVLIVDDVQWADSASVQVLGLLARRMSDLPGVLALGLRTPVEPPLRRALTRTTGALVTHRLELQPLSQGAVAVWAASVLGGGVHSDLPQELWRATGGNPFLVHELLTAGAALPREELARDPKRIAQLTPETVIDAVLHRLESMGSEAGRLAHAVAVLGNAELPVAAALAELSLDATATAAEALNAAGLLAPQARLEFVHPVLREAVHRSIPHPRRGLLHSEAARTLRRAGGDPARIVGHLMAGCPRGDAQAVATLRGAARDALARGAPDAAAELLARAAREPPPESARCGVLLELGTAQAALGESGAVATLEDALCRAQTVRERAAVFLRLARTAGIAGDIQRGKALAEGVAEGPHRLDRDTRAQLEAELISFTRLDPTTRSHALERLEQLAPLAWPPRAATAGLFANLALTGVERNARPDEVAALAQAALEGDWLFEAESFAFAYAANALVWIEHTGAARHAFDRALDVARSRGSLWLTGAARATRSRLHLMTGATTHAEEDARVAHCIFSDTGAWQAAAFSRAHLANALVARGEWDRAAEVLEGHRPEEHVHSVPVYLDSLGHLALARHDAASAARWFSASGEALARRGGVDAPAVLPWRSRTALALVRVEERDRAAALAREERSLAEASGVAGALGQALMALGVIQRDLQCLHEAVEVLEGSPRKLVHAEALLELGRERRRRRQPSAARRPLEEALDLAHRSGAVALEQRIRHELRATGARPRRSARSGVQALTPSEHRVAQLASRGLSNRDIAAELFVSLRTVTTHLTHVYRKLGVEGRERLPAALATPAPPDAPRP